MTNHKLYSHPNPLKGFILWVLLFVLIYWLTSCDRDEIIENKYNYDNYAVIVAKYSLDTQIHYRSFIWWKRDSIYLPSMKLSLDTTKDNWFVSCSTPDSLEQWYVTKNGNKIQPSKYPKN